MVKEETETAEVGDEIVVEDVDNTILVSISGAVFALDRKDWGYSSHDHG